VSSDSWFHQKFPPRPPFLLFRVRNIRAVYGFKLLIKLFYQALIWSEWNSFSLKCLISAMMNNYYVSHKQSSWHIKLKPLSGGISEQHCYTLLKVRLQFKTASFLKKYKTLPERRKCSHFPIFKKNVKIYLKLLALEFYI